MPDTRSDVPWFLDITEILLVLRVRPRLAALSSLAVLGAALLLMAVNQPHYTASTKLLIDPRGLQIVKDGLDPPSQASDASLLLVDSQVQVLTSDDVLRKVVDRLGLDGDPEFDGQHGLVQRVTTAARKVLRLPAAAPDPKLNALRLLRQRLSVVREERTFALSVNVTTTDRQKSARIARAVAETYLSDAQQVQSDLAQRASAALTGRLGELRSQLAAAEDKAQQYRAAFDLSGTRNQLVSERQLDQTNDQLGNARARAEELKARLSQVEAALKLDGASEALPQVLQSPTVLQLRSQLATAQRLSQNLSTQLGARHPSLIAAQSEVRSAATQLTNEIKRIASSVGDEYRGATEEVASLSARLEQGKKAALSVGGSLVQLKELERQSDALRNVYESFLVRARELQEQQELGTSASRIISPAIPPVQRDGPALIALIAVAVALGVGSGILTALAAEFVSGRIRTRRRLQGQGGLEVVGALPPIGPSRSGEVQGSRPDGPRGVAVAGICSRIWRQSSGLGGQLIVVMASDPASEQSQLALDLARIAATGQNRILLVDADPEQDLVRELGLQTVQSTARPTSRELAFSERRITELPGLSYIRLPARLAGLISKSILDGIFARSADYDAVIVNGGLVGDNLMTERLVASSRPLLVLLTVNASKTTFEILRRSLTKLDRRSNVAAVLTDAYAEDV